MALKDFERIIAAQIAQKNPEPDYLIRLSVDNPFAIEEIKIHKEKIKEDLLKEKQSHEDRMNNVLVPRLSKIDSILAAIEEFDNDQRTE